MNRQYNPNTRYGRKKVRQEFNREFANKPFSEQAENTGCSCLILLVIFVVFGGLIFLIGGPEALKSWLK